MKHHACFFVQNDPLASTSFKSGFTSTQPLWEHLSGVAKDCATLRQLSKTQLARENHENPNSSAATGTVTPVAMHLQKPLAKGHRSSALPIVSTLLQIPPRPKSSSVHRL